MATVATLPSARQQTLLQLPARSGVAAVLICSAVAILLLGYHPAAEDGGIYAAATALRLQPDLFPAERGFAVAHTAHSLFVPLLTACVHVLHLPLAWALLLSQALSIMLTVSAAQTLLKQLVPQPAVRHGALLVFAVSLGLPIAGTSLYLVDPYLTARSLSTPILLFALTCLLKRRALLCSTCLVAAASLHPMMAAWALPLLLAVLACRGARPVRNAALLASSAGVAMAAALWLGPADSAAMRAASLTRAYWFPSEWATYEMLGLVAPPLLLGLLARGSFYSRLGQPARQLAAATTLATVVTAVPALFLIHTGSSSFLLARLQPMRMLHLVYCVFLLIAGSYIASLPGRWSRSLRWVVPVVAGACLLLMQRQLYSHSGHFELPGGVPVNGYQQAFLWIRDNTPVDALFALDARYTTSPGEDAQLFRAVALRSSLPDAAKDGGISSVVPALAAEWVAASQAQTGLAGISDRERLARVQPLGATWMVLPASSVTRFPCPYRNLSAQVCRLP